MEVLLASLLLLLINPFTGTSGMSSLPAADTTATTLSFSEEVHDFHVSKCLIEYNEQERALQISLHLFIDDLEEALRQQGADKLFLCTEKEAADAGQHLGRYLEQNFILEVNGRQAAYHFLGKEISDDLAAVWCYLEVPEVDQMEQLAVTNKILTEVYDDQKNIVSVFGPGNQKGLLLFQKGKSRESVSF